jgi:hypothetical protein
VPEGVWRDVLAGQGGAVLSGVLGVEGDASFDSVVAEASSGAGGKQRLVGVVAAFPEPGAQDRGGGRGERHASLLAALCCVENYVASAAGGCAWGWIGLVR